MIFYLLANFAKAKALINWATPSTEMGLFVYCN